MLLSVAVLAHPTESVNPRLTPFTFTSYSFSNPRQTNVNDWAPCLGYNHWNISYTTAGTWPGYADDEAQADSLCSPDTTEHQQMGWVQGSTTFTPSVSGSYTTTAYFYGNISIWAHQYGGTGNGYGHAYFEIGVALYPTASIPSTPTFTWSTVVSDTTDGACCTFSQNVTMTDSSVSVTSSSLVQGTSYTLLGAIMDQDGAYETASGTNAQSAVMFGNACYIWNSACTTQVNLVELRLV